MASTKPGEGARLQPRNVGDPGAHTLGGESQEPTPTDSRRRQRPAPARAARAGAGARGGGRTDGRARGRAGGHALSRAGARGSPLVKGQCALTVGPAGQRRRGNGVADTRGKAQRPNVGKPALLRSRERWGRTPEGTQVGAAHVAAVRGAPRRRGLLADHAPEAVRSARALRRAGQVGRPRPLRSCSFLPDLRVQNSLRSCLRRRSSPATQLSPVMQGQEDGDSILPFAKCSRVVSRPSPCSLPSRSSRPMPQPYGDTFWENLSQRSSSNWMEEQYIPPILRATGCSQPGLYPLEGLPPPEKLWRRKRRKLHLERMQTGPGNIPARVRAVTYHLEDLRRRQRVINELKKAQWGSSEATSELPVLEEGYGFLSTTEYLDVEEEKGTYPEEENYFVTPRDQLLWSPWTPLGQEGTYASGRLNSLAHSTVTARRNHDYNPPRMEPEE